MFIPALMLSIVMVTKFFICFILIVPMVLVPVIIAFADEYLSIRPMSSEFGVFHSVFVIVQIRPGIIQYYFMAMIKIEIWISRRKVIRKYPATISQVNKLMARDKIITADIRDIIIIHMIVSDGSPGWLVVNIDANGYLRGCSI
jgi:hypothetical protein